MNFGFSGEMIFLFFLALILFGPKKLPEIGRQIGRFMNEFRRASNEFRSQIESEINAAEAQSKPQILPPIQAPLGSLASRIFNPPTGKIEAVDTEAAVESEPASSPAPPENASSVETGVAPSHAPASASKVAPDA